MPHPSPPAAASVDRLPVTEAQAAGLDIHKHLLGGAVPDSRSGRHPRGLGACCCMPR